MFYSLIVKQFNTFSDLMSSQTSDHVKNLRNEIYIFSSKVAGRDSISQGIGALASLSCVWVRGSMCSFKKFPYLN